MRGNGHVDSGEERSEEGESSAQQRCTSHIVDKKAEEERNIPRGEEHDTERGRKSSVFLGFTRAFCSKSEWGSTQNVVMIILYWSEQTSRNWTYLLPNKSSTHTVKKYFPSMNVYQFGVDPQ